MVVEEKSIKFLKYLEKYTKTDMIYLAKGSFWWMFNTAGNLFISLIIMISFGRWLSQNDYGTYQFIISVLTALYIFTLPGINTALIKSVAQKKEGTFKLIIKTKIKWGLIGGLLSLGLSCWYFLHGNNLLAIAFLMVGVFVPFTQSFNTFGAFWNGRKRFDLRAKYELTFGILSAFVLIPAIYLTNNVSIILAIFLSSRTLVGIFLSYKTQKQSVNNEEDKTAVSFGKNLTLINAAQQAVESVDSIIIWNFLGPTSVAIYAFARQPVLKIKLLIPIFHLSLPKFSEKTIDENLKKATIKKFLKLFWIAIPGALIFILIAPLMYQILFPKYIDSMKYFQALSVIMILSSPFLLLSTALIAEMKKRALYITNTGSSLLKIILFFILIPYFEIWGVVIAILIGEIIRAFLSLYFFFKKDSAQQLIQ